MLVEEFNELSKLDQAIDKLLTHMLSIDPGTEDYTRAAKQLTELTNVKETLAKMAALAQDTHNKVGQHNDTVRLKESEIQNKKTESDRNADLKEEELHLRERQLNADVAFKSQDLEVKKMEVNASAHLKSIEADAKQLAMDTPDRVSKDQALLVAGNVLGIAMILMHERVHVIASKALGFVLRR